MSTPTRDLSRLTLGTAPDSWGVWFAKDDHQVGWKQYLDEVANAGYVWTELGPQGFLPQDPQPAARRTGLARPEGLRRNSFRRPAQGQGGAGQGDRGVRPGGEAARARSAPKYLIHLPEQYTDMHTGAAAESADMDPEQWSNLVSGTNELGRVIFEEYGVELVFHPHADTHVDTQDRILEFLKDTDPQFVNLCLDTGHIAYCDGDNLQIIERAPERITYVHLKLVDPEVRERVQPEKLSLAEAVPLGVMVEPPVRGTRDPAAAGRAGRARPGDLHRHRAGPVPGRAAHAAGHPGPRRRLLRRLRPRPDPPLAVLIQLRRTAWLSNPLTGRLFSDTERRRHRRRNDRAGPHPATHPGAVGGPGRPGSPTWTWSGRRAWSTRSPAPSCTRAGQELIDSPEVDAIVIASWGGTHEEYVLAGIAAGKQVFCEKPLATTKEACERILDAEVAAGRRLVMVGFMRRYDDGYRAMKETLDRGDIGAPLVFHSAHRNPAVPDSVTTEGVIVDTCVHDIDTSRWLLDSEVVAAQLHNPRRSSLAA